MNIKVVIEKGEDGYYAAYCPALKSYWTQEKTEEALKNISEAIELYLEPEEELFENKNHKVYEVAV